MGDNLKIKWFGHSCFKIECQNHTLVIDPYKEVPGYPPLSLEAGMAVKSHDHDDHGYLDAVKIIDEPGESPFSLSYVSTWHDDQGGKLRGENRITIIEAAGKRIAHMGDLGHELDEEQVALVGKCDVILIPVGGYYTIDAPAAKRVTDALGPTVVIPMHFRSGKYGYDVIAEPDEFINMFSDRRVIKAGSSVFEPDDNEEKRVVLLEFDA